MIYSVTVDSHLVALQDWHPILVNGQVQAGYIHLSLLLCDEYRAPASGVGTRRNHKVNKRVHCARHGRMRDEGMERQVLVMQNEAQLSEDLEDMQKAFETVIRCVVRLSLDDDKEEQAGHDKNCDHHDDELEGKDDMMDIVYVVYAAEGLLGILETSLFNGQ